MKMISLKFLFLLIIWPAVNGDDIVHTNSGTVQGKTVLSGKVEAFLGIPFAEPPIGSLRFGKPVPKSTWKDVYVANQLSPSCIQPNFLKLHFVPDNTNMSEDCLYLNVWTPRTNKQSLKPVMFFIFGGGFRMGSASVKLYDGARLSERGDVVVVTVNYRVGGLGFFTGFIDEAPGSVGLYDQVMALQWVKANVKHFGGDPDLITLFGESAGAYSVSMHQISSLSKNLFKRAILQSGSIINPSYSKDNEKIYKTSEAYAEILSCASDTMTLKSNPIEVVDCLRKTPAEKFSEADMMVMRKSLPIVPRIGNDFLPKNPIDAYREGEFKDSEVLMGVNRDEGSILLAAMRPDLFGPYGQNVGSQLLNETTAYLAIKAFMSFEDETRADGIIRSYLDPVKQDSGYTYLKAVSDAIGDILITCGNVFQAEYQSIRANPVYFYMFNHRPSSTPLAEWMGVAHFEEVQYVFGNPLYEEFTESEKELSGDMMDMWVNFARTGDPTLSGGITWPRYTIEDPKYYVIGRRDRIDVRPDHYRCERWRNSFRSVIDDALIQVLKKN